MHGGLLCFCLHEIYTPFSFTRVLYTSNVHRKTTKGTLILIPQMGVIYLLIFYVPRGNAEFNYFVRVIFPLQVSNILNHGQTGSSNSLKRYLL